MRKLASIQKISAIDPIPNADAIEVATVLGWHVVIKKSEFKVGDMCIYCEVDSLLPVIPELEFLAKAGTKKMVTEGKAYEGYRLRTVRLRGQISQGLCLPLSLLKEKASEFKEGDDISEAMGIIKYETPIPAELSGVIKGSFPSHIPKTDEERIQTLPAILERYKGIKFYVTEKVDGTSCTVFIGKESKDINVCSRNQNLKETEGNSFWQIVKELGIQEKLMSMNGSIALQGELIGNGVQGNKLMLGKRKLLLFNAYNVNENRYLNFDEFFALAAKFGLETVPIIDTSFMLPKKVDDLVAYATRKSMVSPDIWAEGVVIRPLIEMQDVDLGRLSFKVINPEFLLKYGD